MQLVQRYPYNTFNAFNQLFNAAGNATNTESKASAWSPAVDITEKENTFEIIADVPGMSAEDVEISVEKRVLLVSGSRSSNVTGDKDSTVRSERVSGTFNRRFTLPDSVDVDGIEAKVTNGVLTVSIPKTAESTTRKIAVQG